MASRSGSYKATLAVVPGFSSCKGIIGSAPRISRSDSKFDELGAPEKGTSAPSHTSTSALSHISTPASRPASAPDLAESTLALKYSKADLMKILKIFLKTKGQESKAQVPRKQPLKTKIPDVYFKKSHIDCYYFC